MLGQGADHFDTGNLFAEDGVEHVGGGLPTSRATIMLMPPSLRCARIAVSSVMIRHHDQRVQLSPVFPDILETRSRWLPSTDIDAEKTSTCLAAIRQAAPAVKPTTTECK